MRSPTEGSGCDDIGARPGQGCRGPGGNTGPLWNDIDRVRIPRPSQFMRAKMFAGPPA
jgi:hypothetical protein